MKEKTARNGNPSFTRSPRSPSVGGQDAVGGHGDPVNEVNDLRSHRMNSTRYAPDRAETPRRLVRQHALAVELGVTDKRVATWRSRSRVNGFPAPVAQYEGTSGPGRPGARNLWDLEECLEWFRGYDIAAQRRRSGDVQRGRKWSHTEGRWLTKEEQ